MGNTKIVVDNNKKEKNDDVNKKNSNKVVNFDDSYDSDSSFGSFDIPMMSDEESPRF